MLKPYPTIAFAASAPGPKPFLACQVENDPAGARPAESAPAIEARSA
jgi:hypothetical protein